MYDQLRTKEQLGYYVGCSRKKTGGIYGLSFVLQSAEYSPIILQDKILDFIDKFYYEILDEPTFKKYKKGVLNRLKAGYSGLEHEADALLARLIHFSLDPSEDIDWDRRELEVKAIDAITFDELKSFYHILFCPQPQKLAKSVTTRGYIERLLKQYDSCLIESHVAEAEK